MIVQCSLCGMTWTKDDPTDERVSHGFCEPCADLYDKVIDGELTLEEAKERAKKTPSHF